MEVIYCVSSLVLELARLAEELPTEYYEDLATAYCGPPYECGDCDGEGLNDNGDDCGNCDGGGFMEDCHEVFEHWLVSRWLADKLEAKGEKVIRDFFNMNIWCRCCTGQAISMDYAIQQIAEDLNAPW
jgi:hypothetical protein